MGTGESSWSTCTDENDRDGNGKREAGENLEVGVDGAVERVVGGARVRGDGARELLELGGSQAGLERGLREVRVHEPGHPGRRRGTTTSRLACGAGLHEEPADEAQHEWHVQQQRRAAVRVPERRYHDGGERGLVEPPRRAGLQVAQQRRVRAHHAARAEQLEDEVARDAVAAGGRVGRQRGDERLEQEPPLEPRGGREEPARRGGRRRRGGGRHVGEPLGRVVRQHGGQQVRAGGGRLGLDGGRHGAREVLHVVDARVVARLRRGGGHEPRLRRGARVLGRSTTGRGRRAGRRGLLLVGARSLGRRLRHGF
jgi:hypothetical protein